MKFLINFKADEEMVDRIETFRKLKSKELGLNINRTDALILLIKSGLKQSESDSDFMAA